MEKRIFVYWDKGFKFAPDIVQKCLLSVKLNHKDWEIIELDNNNLNKYININEEIKDFYKKEISIQAFSDIVRVFLLEKYGGFWLDATVFLKKPLDEILSVYDTDFFGCKYKSYYSYGVQSWLLYSVPMGYVITRWKKSVINYVNKMSSINAKILSSNHHENRVYWYDNKYNNIYYFWFYYLFEDLLENDKFFLEIYNNMNSIYDKDHYLWKKDLYRNDDDINLITKLNKKSFFKMNRNIDTNKINATFLNILFKDFLYEIIDIQSTGYHSVNKIFNNLFFIKEFNNNNNKKILWIRNPVEKFLKLFYSITDNKKLFDTRLYNLVCYFKNIDNLIESIDNPNYKIDALELIYYLLKHCGFNKLEFFKNDEFINNIIFVGRYENIYEDCQKLSSNLSTKYYLNHKINNMEMILRENQSYNHILITKSIFKKIKDILRFEYYFLDSLVEKKLLDEKTIKNYNSYEYFKLNYVRII